MNNRISICILVLALVLLVRPLCVPAAATSDEIGTWGNLVWNFSGGSLTISGNGPMEDNADLTSAPWSHLAEDVNSINIENGVTSIADAAFYNFHSLRSVSFSETVVEIGDYAFYNCTTLVDITDEYYNHRIADSVESIGEGAFAGCSNLQAVILGDNVRYLGDYAFSDCTSLEKVVLSPALETIGDYAFEFCGSIKSLFIPASVTDIGEHAFGECYKITNICFEGNAPEIHARAFESHYGSIQAMVYYPKGNTSWTSAKRGNYGAALIWATKANDCLAMGTLGDNLSWSMTDDGTLRISGNGQMDSFGWWYDAPWSHLSEMVEAIYIEDGITSVSQYAFLDFQRASALTLPHSLTDIGMYAFFKCYSLERIISGDDENALPDSLQTIGTGAFCNCNSLQEIEMGPNVVSVGSIAFDGCWSLEKITLSPAMTDIAYGTFNNCYQLRTILIPEMISCIEEDAFAGCDNLRSIGFAGDAPEIHDTAFSGAVANVYYPKGNTSWIPNKLANYGGALTWKPTDAKYLSGEVPEDNLEWFLPQDGILVITGNGAMADYPFGNAPWADLYDCVYTVYIDEGVTTIGENAFYGFENMTMVHLPNSLTKIGNAAFSDCYELYWILNPDLEQKLPDGIATIGDEAFGHCTSLPELTMGKNVTSVGNRAFSYCLSLKQITLSESLSYIGDYAFTYSDYVQTIYFPAEVSYIGDNAFTECSRLNTIVFAGDAPVIHDQAFGSNWETIQMTAYYPAGNTSWSADKRVGYGADITWKTKAADCIGIGSCGENLTWELEQNGTLRISGNGPMYNYDTIDYPPWYAFKEQITAVVIEEGVTTIGSTAFYKCTQIRTITIPDSVTEIGSSAIFDCDSLTSIEISAYVTNLHESAIYSCDILEKITVAKDNPDYTSDRYGVLYTKDMTTLIKAPGAIEGHYSIPFGVTQIGYAAFEGCVNMTEVTIPNTVSTIGNSAFMACLSLKSVTIPASVTLIDHAAFWCCTELEKIVFCGDAPVFVEDSIFTRVTATATYPAGNTTWTEDKFIHPDSNITWQAFEPENIPHYHSFMDGICTICGANCAHENWYDANCVACGMQCQHQWKYTYLKNSSHTFTCSGLCDQNVSIADTDSKKFAINSASLVLSDDIIMKYSTTIPAGFENPYVVFDFNGESTVVNEYAVNASNGRYEFSFPGLNPQKMGDNICATLYATVDGVPVSVQIASYSIVKYCDNQLKKTTISAELRTALSDLLIYGECNQIYENYKTDTLITSLLSANSTLTPSTFPEGGLDASFNKQKLSGTSLADCTFSGVTMSLGAKVVVRLIITCNDISKYTFKATLNGVDFVFTGEDLVPVEGSTNKYYLNFDQIKATLLGDVITFTIWDGDTQVSRTVEYTAYTYVQKNQGTTNETLANLLKALYNYGESVKKV